MIDQDLKNGMQKIASKPIEWDCVLAPFTSFGIGGAADALVEVTGRDELCQLLSYCNKHVISWRVIGRGTNLLVSDKGFSGVVFVLGKGIAQIEIIEQSTAATVCIRVGAGCSLAKLLHWCTERSYAGLEFTAGIPGSLGGAVVMNAGAWGYEIGECIDSLSVFSEKYGVEDLARENLDFGYRIWNNQKNEEWSRVVLLADITLQCGNKETIQERCRDYSKQRKAKQPKVSRNAGSFFKNPEGDSAGRLIDASGLKGTQYGDAMVSPVHANFIVNTGTATSRDVCKLMEIVMTKVKKDSGVQLIPEVHIL